MQLDGSGRQRQLSDITGPDIRTLRSGLGLRPPGSTNRNVERY